MKSFYKKIQNLFQQKFESFMTDFHCLSSYLSIRLSAVLNTNEIFRWPHLIFEYLNTYCDSSIWVFKAPLSFVICSHFFCAYDMFFDSSALCAKMYRPEQACANRPQIFWTIELYKNICIESENTHHWGITLQQWPIL